MATAPVVGVDVGGSGIKGAPVDVAGGRLVADRVKLPTPQPATPDAVAAVVARIVEATGVPGPIGVTLPGVVQRGVLRTAANIDPAWVGVDAKELFSRATGRAVEVVNDADAAGIAEMRFGAGRGRRGVVLMLTLGTGIGSALFLDGTLVPNTELGHIPRHHHDWEDYAASSVREAEGLSWKEWARRLEEYLLVVHGLLWPDLVILGGGVSRQADRFLPRIDVPVEVVPAVLRNEAGIVGAALAGRAG